MSTLIKTTPEELAKILQKGLAADFEQLIYDRLMQQAMPIIQQLAKEISMGVATRMDAIYAHDTFGPKAIVELRINGNVLGTATNDTFTPNDRT